MPTALAHDARLAEEYGAKNSRDDGDRGTRRRHPALQGTVLAGWRRRQPHICVIM